MLLQKRVFICLQNQELITDEGKAVLEVVSNYAKTWTLLLQYDEQQLALPQEKRRVEQDLGYQQAKKAIVALKKELMTKGEASDLFGQERRVFDPAVVKGMVAESGLQIVGIYGLRVFADLLPGGTADWSEWLALEAAAGTHPSLRSIARFLQIIAVKTGRLGSGLETASLRSQ